MPTKTIIAYILTLLAATAFVHAKITCITETADSCHNLSTMQGNEDMQAMCVCYNQNAPPFVPKTVLFKITASGTAKVSYLFGTHHAFGKAFFDSLQNAHQALLSSDVLIKENLNTPGHLAEDIINQRKTQTPWTKYLNKADYQFVSNIFSDNLDVFLKMTPTELHVFLSRHYKENVCLSKDTSGVYFSLDDYIGSIGEENNLELIGLETTEEQLEVIRKDVEGMPRKVHKKRLAVLIKNIRLASSDHCAEIEWYRNMDFDYKLEQPCRNALVLTDRNNKWMSEIKSLIQTQNCFIAVGLSHLMFACGLINQLTRLGYTITPVAVQ